MPWATVWLVGNGVRPKSGAFTTRVTVAVCVKLPLVPVIVTVYVPVGVVVSVVSDRVELEPAGFGLKLVPTLLGRPLAPRVTCPENPFSGFSVML